MYQGSMIMNTSEDVRRPLKFRYTSTRTVHSEIADDESDRVRRDRTQSMGMEW
jgi:hypothetical protein